jgi:uncharacterized membrane protein YhiD involved in acid resistance
MLFWTIQITVISIVLIFLVHHLINFFKSTLTVPKIKDLVNTPTQKYENMYNIINNNQHNNQHKNQNTHKKSNLDNEYSLIDLLPKPETNMKSELKSFLKSQLSNSKTNETVISNLDSMSNVNTYSNY